MAAFQAALDIDKGEIDSILEEKVDGENLDRSIVIKDSKKGPNLHGKVMYLIYIMLEIMKDYLKRHSLYFT